jgi:hypothetical protein
VSQTASVGGRTNRPGGVPPPAGATKSLSAHGAHAFNDRQSAESGDWINARAAKGSRYLAGSMITGDNARQAECTCQ